MTDQSAKRATLSDSPNINALWSALIVEELARNGVRFFCLSPGSRSAPLALAVAGRPGARHAMHFDERGAAFHALGYTKATQRPAALVCTSGTAAANYLPAIVEAAMSRVPLIVLTADRPPELLDTGANQTIHQPGIFSHYTRWDVTLPCPDEAVPPQTLLTTIDYAVHRATGAPAGPVHVNAMFREPLAPTATDRDFAPYVAPLAKWEAAQTPYTAYAPSHPVADTESHERVLELLRGARHGLIIAGALPGDAGPAVRELAQTLNWPVFADIASGLRLGSPAPPVVHHYDLLLSTGAIPKDCRPDVILQLGGAFVSKRLLQFLDHSPPGHYILVDENPDRLDPAHRVSLRVEASPARFCAGICRGIASGMAPAQDPAWAGHLYGLSETVNGVVAETLTQYDYLTEPTVARAVAGDIPAGHTLFLGNSMPIRDMDRFASPHGAPVRVAVNRGASGIDGNIATAAGFARGAQTPVTALLGDLALLHDLNALAMLRELPQPVTLVVVNNDGGGIFSFLPVAGFPEHFEELFGTPHALTFAKAAELFGLQYAAPESLPEFKAAYRAAAAQTASTLIEVRTNREDNLRVHQALRIAITSACSA